MNHSPGTVSDGTGSARLAIWIAINRNPCKHQLLGGAGFVLVHPQLQRHPLVSATSWEGVVTSHTIFWGSRNSGNYSLLTGILWEYFTSCSSARLHRQRGFSHARSPSLAAIPSCRPCPTATPFQVAPLRSSQARPTTPLEARAENGRTTEPEPRTGR